MAYNIIIGLIKQLILIKGIYIMNDYANLKQKMN